MTPRSPAPCAQYNAMVDGFIVLLTCLCGPILRKSDATVRGVGPRRMALRPKAPYLLVHIGPTPTPPPRNAQSPDLDPHPVTPWRPWRRPAAPWRRRRRRTSPWRRRRRSSPWRRRPLLFSNLSFFFEVIPFACPLFPMNPSSYYYESYFRIRLLFWTSNV
jgi:hypothetical protein